MAKVKLFTDLEQSKQLAKILPIESADMWYHNYAAIFSESKEYLSKPETFHSRLPLLDFPCWSLAALLDVLPIRINADTGYYIIVTQGNTIKWHIEYTDFENRKYVGSSDDVLIDACYKLILKTA